VHSFHYRDGRLFCEEADLAIVAREFKTPLYVYSESTILDHYRRPRNFGELPDAAVLVHGDNPACGDEIHLAVKFDPNGGLEDIKFSGHGCAISQASASLMTTKLKGKSRQEVMEMLRAFHDLVTADASESPKALGDLRVMQGVRKFPQRVKCAMLLTSCLYFPFVAKRFAKSETGR
jgi:nitrogen fixation NifU-like protein